tara:strand:+ start:237 stop:515 length:279 start_codon:yes stop_codon:yes gene_type:complete
MATWLNLFKQDQDGNKPLYSNNKVTFEQEVVLKADTPYQVALWKKTETSTGKQVDMVSIKIEENTFTTEVKVEPVKQVENVSTQKHRDDIPF